MRKWIILLPVAALVGCGGEEDVGGSGGLTLQVSGEEAARTGYPVPGAEELAFADGWQLKFDKYLVGLGHVRIEGSDGATALRSDDSVVVDLTRGEPTIFTFADLDARRWDRFGYDILPPAADTRPVGDIAPADLERMRAEGLNYLIAGTATKGDRVLHFEWGLANATHNDDCINSADGTHGVVVRNNATAQYQLTLHLDHLFYDRLGSHEGVKMRFEPIAAKAVEVGGSWQIPFDALAQQRLADLRDADGQVLRDENGSPLVYDPENVPLPDRNLRDYLLAASRSQGRFNGEGTCVNTSLR